MANEAESEGLAVPARTIPVPTSVSPEAQRMLAMPSPFGGSGGEPDPSNKAAWEKHTRERNEMMAHMLAERVDPATAPSVTEHKLTHATLYEIEPKQPASELADKALYYIHGGGFTVGGGVAAAYAAYGMAALTGLRGKIAGIAAVIAAEGGLINVELRIDI